MVLGMLPVSAMASFDAPPVQADGGIYDSFWVRPYDGQTLYGNLYYVSGMAQAGQAQQTVTLPFGATSWDFFAMPKFPSGNNTINYPRCYYYRVETDQIIDPNNIILKDRITVGAGTFPDGYGVDSGFKCAVTNIPVSDSVSGTAAVPVTLFFYYYNLQTWKKCTFTYYVTSRNGDTPTSWNYEHELFVPVGYSGAFDFTVRSGYQISNLRVVSEDSEVASITGTISNRTANVTIAGVKKGETAAYATYQAKGTNGTNSITEKIVVHVIDPYTLTVEEGDYDDHIHQLRAASPDDIRFEKTEGSPRILSGSEYFDIGYCTDGDDGQSTGSYVCKITDKSDNYQSGGVAIRVTGKAAGNGTIKTTFGYTDSSSGLHMYVDVINVTVTKRQGPQPDTPPVPDKSDKDVRETTVSIKCVQPTSVVKHNDDNSMAMSLGDYPSAYTLGTTVEQETVNGKTRYYVTCTIDNVAPYISAFNTLVKSDHSETTERESVVTTKLWYHPENKESGGKLWIADPTLTIYVKCDQTETPPRKPSMSDFANDVLVHCENSSNEHADARYQDIYLGTTDSTRYTEVKVNGENVWQDADGKWTYQIKLNKDKYIEAFNTNPNIKTTHTDTNPEEETYVTWKHDGTSWKLVPAAGQSAGIGAVINVTCKPKAPTAGELKELDMAVLVKCAVDGTQQHARYYGLLGDLDYDYYVGEPKEINGDWFCTIEFAETRYVEAFTTELLGHVRNDEKVVPVTLIWDGSEWTYKTQGRVEMTEEYTVTFDPDNGTAETTQNVIYGGKATEPAEPKKPGYTFKGWYLGEAEAPFDFGTPITSDITLTAKWELAEVDVNTYILPSNDDGMLNGDDALKPSTLERVGLPTAYTDKTEYESIHVGKFASKAAAEAAVAGEYDDYKDPDEEPLLTALTERETGFQLLTGIDREKFNKLNINWRWLHVAAGTDADPEHYLLGMLDFYWARFDENDGGDGTVKNMPTNVYDLVYDYYLPGEIITMPTNPTRDGYTFLGWEAMERPDRPIISSVSPFDAGTTKLYKYGEAYTIGTKDVMFVARWEKTTYTIQYVYRDGKATSTNPTTYTVESETITLTDATGADWGKTFLEWHDEKGQKITAIPTGSTGDRVITAYWNWPVHLHYLDKNNNEVESATLYVSELEPSACDLPTGEKTGYDFDGWYEAKKDIGNANLKLSSLSKAKKWELYGRYTATEYTIRYDYRDGKATSTNPTTYTIESDTITLADATGADWGKTFLEWHDENDQKITKIPTGSTGNRVIKAYWNWPVHLHYLDKDNNEIESATLYVSELDPSACILPTGEKIGYDFDGWYEAKNDIGTASHKLNALSMAKKWELYGRYTAKTDVSYTVKYLRSGDDKVLATEKVVTGQTFDTEVTEEAATVKGYTADAASKKLVLDDYNKVLTFYYTPNTYNYEIHYYVQQPDGSYVEDASALDTTKSGTFDSTVTVTPDANKYGAHFSVNNTKSKLSGVVTVDTQTEILKLEVYYDRDFHTLTYLDSRNGSVIGTTTVRCGVSAAAPKDPTKAGYWFDGWYNAADNKKVTFPVTLTNNMTVYAGWTMIVLPSTIAKKTPKLNTADHFAYVQGYPDGTVKPAGNITRAETAAILFRLMDESSRSTYYSTRSGFRDVASGTWYNTYVATLNNAGVITDNANGYFRPNDAITRAELAAMLAAFTDTTRAANYFNDVTANYWAANAIAICAKLGWINGYPDGSFRPDRNVTRAELMAMINRATGRAPKSADAFLPGMKTWSDNTADKWYYLDVQEATNSHSYTVRPTEIWTAITAAPNWSKYE